VNRAVLFRQFNIVVSAVQKNWMNSKLGLPKLGNRLPKIGVDGSAIA
jgi:hypothetical protein